MSTLVMAMSTCSAGFVLSPVRPFVRQANILMAADEDTSGMGFGNSNAEAEERGRKALEALRAASNESLSLEDISELLGLPLVGVIPESKSVLTSTNLGQPVIAAQDDAAEAYKDVVQRFLGNDLPLRFVTPESKGFFTRIMEAARNSA